MGQQRLNALAMLSIESQLIQELRDFIPKELKRLPRGRSALRLFSLSEPSALEVLYEQRVILDSVNSALASFRFASSPIDEDQVLIMRAQQHSDIQSLMKSNLDQEADLSEVLQSLQDMSQGLTEMDKDIPEVKDMTEERPKIQKFMSDMEACFTRLHELCGLKNTQKEAAGTSECVWRWWQDPKEMEKLQPPSVSRILMDPNLANQSRADLSLMVENIAEAMSCKAAMRMAFRFIQDGLHTLNMALQEQTLKVKNGQARLKAEDCIAKEQLEGNRRRINQLEAEKHQLQEAIAAQQFQIRKLQYTGKRGSAEDSLPMSRSVLLTEVTPAPSKYVKLPPIARDEQKSIIHLPQILAKAEEDHPVRAGFWDGSTKSPGDMHKQIANDCKLHLFPPTPRPSNSSKVVTDKPCKSTRSQNTVRRCHRLPPIAQAIPLDLVQASAETKLPAPKTQTSRDRMFYIVDFISTNKKETEVVPASWVKDGMSYWPPYASAERCSRAVKREELPGETWGLFDVVIRYTSGK
ncbi:hypothetical protein DPEC_G00043750 [Dallia pectoralis]|uniref:Uncharacterized protein n=1 Tax=Dallia pectoralis TaxID=75939 RepID=A0ACC2H9B7_DALPE|nr:hypothetical protein DPEC_G00043750 [Dallia pectoralis]